MQAALMELVLTVLAGVCRGLGAAVPPDLHGRVERQGQEFMPVRLAESSAVTEPAAFRRSWLAASCPSAARMLAACQRGQSCDG
jgi:hypothetical protein